MPRHQRKMSRLQTAVNPLFVADCASCHGGGGAGNGPAAGALAPSPANFHLKKPSAKTGLGCFGKWLGTAMPPWRSELSTRSAARASRIRALFIWSAARELRTMITLIVISVSAIMLALLLVWWRWPAFRVWNEAPKYSMLQKRRFDDHVTGKGISSSASSSSSAHFSADSIMSEGN